MDTLYITEEAFDRLLAAANSGGWSTTAVTLLDEHHNQTDRVVPGKLHWIVAENNYDAVIVCIQHDGKAVLVEREDI